MCAETDAWGECVFVWTKPGVALCLLEYPVESGIVSVVVHGSESETRSTESVPFYETGKRSQIHSPPPPNRETDGHSFRSLIAINSPAS